MSDYIYTSAGSIRVPRTRFDLSHHVKTMFNAGQIIPIDWMEVYPGDSIKANLNTAVRTTAPFIRPVMDNMFMDIYSFFVPNRLLFDDWKAIFGENDESAWTEETNPTVPQVTVSKVEVGDLADYLGIPPADYEDISTPFNVNALPFRAYALIYNEYFRNQNVDTPVYINKGDTVDSLNSDPWSPTNIYGKPAVANKLNDYFTACLPQPQKGDPVYISAHLDLPVVTGAVNDASVLSSGRGIFLADVRNGSALTSAAGILTNPGGGNPLGIYGTPPSGAVATLPGFSNLHAVSNGSPVATAETALFDINELREAKALQVSLEKDARGGTRYIEYLYSHWNVVADPKTLQRPELLGGVRTPLNIQQVAQTSGSVAESTTNLLAQVGAMSLSNPHAGFEKGFIEHGIVMTVAIVRHHHTYQQGIDKAFFRSTRYSYYDPCFAHIGEQPVYKREIDVIHQGDTTNVFGYQEAFADLRMRPSRISGALRSAANNGFDVWTFADEYANTPSLSAEFLKETSAYIDRALAVPSTTAPQFIFDGYYQMYAIRNLPKYSIPSYLD